MSERALGLSVVLVALSAFGAVGVPLVVCVGVVIAAVAFPRPQVLVLALCIVATSHASAALGGVGSIDHVESYRGTATLVSDPEAGAYSWRYELRLDDGRRVRATSPSDDGPTVAELRMGQRVRLSGRIEPLDAPRSWMRSRHLAGAVTVDSVASLDGGSWWWRSANAAQRLAVSAMDDLDADDRALLRGILFGDDRDQDPLQTYRFRSAGISHLLAVSGQNVALAVGLMTPLLHRLARTPRVVVTTAVVVWFVLVTRAEASVVRAATMVVVAGAGWWLGRYVSVARVLATSVIVLVLADPLIVWSLGFQLSVGACCGLCWFVGPLSERMRGPRWLRLSLSVALSAQAIPGVLLAVTFGPQPLCSAIINLVAVPVGGAIMTVGLVAAPSAALIDGPLAGVIMAPLRALLWCLDVVATIGGHRWWLRCGVSGAVALATAVAAPAVVDAMRHHRLSGGIRTWANVAMFVAGGVLIADAAVMVSDGGRAERPELRDSARGIQRYKVGAQHVWVIAHGAHVDGALDVMARAPRPRADVIIVTSGGLASSAVALALRSIDVPSAILAARPETVRDAAPLPTAAFSIDGVWVVVEPDATLRSASAASG